LNQKTNIPTIHVGIQTTPEISFVLNGRFQSSEINGMLTGECVARLSGGIIAIEHKGASLAKVHEVTLCPQSSDSSFILRDVTIGVQFHWQRKEDQRFLGCLKLVRSDGGITAINVVSIEEYLTSVISSEMSAGSSLNLLEAHAITSRSWLLAQLEKSRTLKASSTKYQTFFETETERIRWYDREDHELFDVCADDHCQRYQGITKAHTKSVQKAVSDTRGYVVTYNGTICDARFSKSCGGITEAFENVWEPVHYPYLAPVMDAQLPLPELPHDFSKEEIADTWIRSNPPAFCNTTDKQILSQVLLKYDQETTEFFRWRIEYSQDDLAEIICRRSGIEFGQIVDLVPMERGKSSRLIRLKIVGTNKTLTIGKELEIRRTLSNSHLYSSAFVIEKKEIEDGIPMKFVLRGAGWGHGVGLCQIGAAMMGEQGYSFEKILSHYFPNTEIKKLY
jgi:SpoIID/LytB domain protein